MPRKRSEVPPDPETLLTAYANGAFPMADPDTGRVSFYSCDPRCVLPLDERFHVAKSLARRVRSGRFEIRVDTSFTAVMRACAVDRGGDNRCWINERLIAAYSELHALGFAHSVEAWTKPTALDDSAELVGGLYGVAIGAAFFGESMFSLPDRGGRDASKVCLVHLVELLRSKGFRLLDSQFANDHILRFGAIELPAEEYLTLLEEAIVTQRLWS
jgi:leucyl/phenylalanyl-tRNA---protein transferase